MGVLGPLIVCKTKVQIYSVTHDDNVNSVVKIGEWISIVIVSILRNLLSPRSVTGQQTQLVSEVVGETTSSHIVGWRVKRR